MQERLQKIISAAGIASRRAAEELIKAGRVTVNGETALLGMRADAETDEICVDGQSIRKKAEHTYVMLHKPRGYVTTLSDEKGRRTVAELVQDVGTRIYPVGRLDMDSDGLLLLTDDGELANALMHPRHEIDKTYRTVVSGADIEKAVQQMLRPMDIDGYRIKTPAVSLLGQQNGRYILDITIHEGRNRQVRKMCAQCSLTVHKLTRISEGCLALGDLPPGKWRYLSENEINSVKKSISAQKFF